MFGQWGFFLATDQVPELQTAPFQIYFHLAAEFITAAGLITGGIGLLTRASWAPGIHLAAAGMLLYSVIASPGVFAQQRQWALVGLFGLLWILASASIATVIRAQRT